MSVWLPPSLRHLPPLIRSSKNLGHLGRHPLGRWVSRRVLSPRFEHHHPHSHPPQQQQQQRSFLSSRTLPTGGDSCKPVEVHTQRHPPPHPYPYPGNSKLPPTTAQCSHQLRGFSSSNGGWAMIDALQRVAKLAPRTALSLRGGLYSYASILDSSDALASQISKLPSSRGGGVGPRIGVYAEPGPEYVASTYAIWQAGGIAVPLATSHPPAELAYVFQDAGLSAVLAPSADQGKFKDLSLEYKAALLEVEPLRTMAAAPPGTEVSKGVPQATPLTGTDQGALIIYTSGTTGKPKGVLHTHRSLASQVNSLVSAWEWSSEDKILHGLPLHHIHGIVNALYCPLSVGAEVHILPKFSPTSVWNAIKRREVSVFMGVPTMYSILLSQFDKMSPEEQMEAQQGAAALRLTVSGSSACPVPIMQRWKELSGSYLLERYGMTEIGMAMSNPFTGERRPGAVGRPLPGVEAKISPDGELLIRGGSVFKEYWGRDDATTEAFDAEGFFRTGDTAGVSGQPEYFSILGRTSVDIIKSAGYKISALQIESAVLEHPQVVEVAVLGVPDEAYGEIITALVVMKSEADSSTSVKPSQEELSAFLRDRLAGYQIPKRWKFMEALPRNAMGKVNKKELLKSYLSSEASAAVAS